MGQHDKPEETRSSSGDESQSPDQAGTRRSGEGAASAMAHMISEGASRRNQNCEADDAAGHPQ